MKTISRRIIILFSALALLIITEAAQAQFRLTNPILSGFYPDPSICKAGDDYYLVTSTFSFFPGLPVFHSKDLQNWKQVGNVISRPSQMDFMGENVSRGLFAPAVNYYKGTFYVTCTDIDNGGNFVVTAKNPAGPWSDPVWIKEVKGIDPSLFFDDEKAYIIYNSDPPDNKSLYDGHRTLRMYEFDVNNLRVIGSEKLIVNGGVDISKKPVWIEGPHIYKRNGFYYLIAAEGGTAVNHSEVVLRSRNAAGPYIPYEKNPILTQRHLNPDRQNPVTSTGHADIVEGPDGKDYAVFIAVRPYEGNYYNTGRETFIAPVKWVDGWPLINPDHQEVQYNYPVDYSPIPQKGALPMSGNFSYRINFRDTLHSQFLFLRTHDPSWYNFGSKKNHLTLNLRPETASGTGNPAFIAKRQQHLTATASTEMYFTPVKENESAGLMIFQNEDHYYFLARTIISDMPHLTLYQSDPMSETDKLLASVVIPEQGKLFLRIDARQDKYDFKYAFRKNKWQVLKANVDGKFLSTEVAGGFVGSVFALYATSNGLRSTSSASFKWLDYLGNDAVHDRKNLKSPQ